MAGAAPTGRPAPFLKPLDLLDRGVLLAESALSLVIVMIMVFAAVAESIAGLAGYRSEILDRASDVLMHGTIWAAFLGASFATRGRKHLAIDAIGRLLPDRIRRAVVAVAATLGAAVAMSLAWGIYQSLLEQVQGTAEQIRQFRESGIADARIDRSYEFHFIIPGGFLFIAIRLLLHAFHEWMAAVRKGIVSVLAPPDGVQEESPRVAPVSQATGVEIAIAIVALAVLVGVSAGTSVMAPLGVAALLAAASLGVPLALRWRTRKSLAPTAPTSAEPWPKPDLREIAIGLAGVATVGAAAWMGIGHVEQIPIGWGIAFFAVMALLGAPLFSFLGGLAMFLWVHGSETIPAMSLPNAVEDVLGHHFARMSVLPTIPVFTLAGYLMSESKTPLRLVRVARAFLGFAPGGLAIVCILASAFFTVFSGASGITIVAIGGLLLPALLKDKYPERFSLGLVTTGGALGITFPPCLPLIVYGIVAGMQEVPPGVEQLQLNKFLLSGIRPGLLIIGLLVGYAMIMGVVAKVPRSRFDRREALSALWDAKWELLLPLFLGGGLAAGLSPGTAAAFTAFYVLVIEVFVYKDLSLTKDLPRIIPDSMVLVGAIFVKLCAATVLTFYFVQAQTADRLFEALTCGPPAEAYLAAHSDTLATCREAVDALAAVGKSAGGIIDSPLTFLIALNIFLLIVGMLMDIFSAIVVMVPLIMGIALHFDINPYHLGVVFLLNLEIGYLMPPMGLNLFIAGFRFNRPVPDLYRVVLPFIGIFALALMITTYVPELTVGSHTHARDRHRPVPAEAPDAGTPATPTADGGAAPEVPPADCDEPKDGESFEDFDRRCTVTGAPDGGAAAPPPTKAPAAAANPADCDAPRDGESFEDFNRRCHITE
jgi:tripartite ATP-independent transporter DctM subunit